MKKEIMFEDYLIENKNEVYLIINNINQLTDYILYCTCNCQNKYKPVYINWTGNFNDFHYEFFHMACKLENKHFEYVFNVAYHTSIYFNMNINEFFQQLELIRYFFRNPTDQFKYFTDLNKWKNEYKIRNREEILKELL